jgi:hypothetical protein
MFQAPTQTPPVLMLLDSLPTQCPRAIGAHLGVSAARVTSWARTGNAPRLAHLALFWETRWGLSVANAHAVNGERIAQALTRSLQAENELLRSRLVELETQPGAAGAANAPWFDPSRPGRGSGRGLAWGQAQVRL